MRMRIFITVALCVCATLMLEVHAADAPVVLVNDASDEVQKIQWNENLSLYDAILIRKTISGFTDRLYYVSNGSLQRFTKFDPVIMKAVKLKPGDVVIFGTLGPEREEKLKNIPELGNVLLGLPAGGRP